MKILRSRHPRRVVLYVERPQTRSRRDVSLTVMDDPRTGPREVTAHGPRHDYLYECRTEDVRAGSAWVAQGDGRAVTVRGYVRRGAQEWVVVTGASGLESRVSLRTFFRRYVPADHPPRSGR